MTPPFFDAPASPVPARVTALPARTRDDEDHPVPTKPLDLLEQEICELAGHIAAATCRWLLLVAEFDRRDGWCVDGVLSMAHWLSWKCGFGLTAAREHVRVARALTRLPNTRDAFMQGQLSYTKVRAITRADAPEIDRQLVEIARCATGAQVDRIVAGYRRVGRLAAGEAKHDFYGRWYYDEDGCVILQARLAPEDGLQFVKKWEAARNDLRGRGSDPPAGTSYPQDMSVDRGSVASLAPEDRGRSSGRLGADALVHLAASAFEPGLAIDDHSERYLAMIHVDANTLWTGQADDDSLCELNNGWAISPTLARLLTCDGSVARAIVDADGKILDIGRKSRVVSKRLARALKCRDRHCRAPGCTNAVYSWHHVQHWADGGPTDKTNLVGLCKAHHHGVHDRGFVIATSGDEVFRFYRPDLTRIPDVPGAADVSGRLEDQQSHLVIDADTVGGNWQGDKLHLHYVIDVLMRKPRQQEAS
jgi:hypothetical protein